MKTKAEQMPALRTDADAEKFVEEADLTKYDLSGFKPVRFEFSPKTASLNMRLPEALLDAVRAKAKAQGIPYARFIRMVLEDVITHN